MLQLLAALTLLLPAGTPPDVARLRWMSPDNSKPLTFREWCAQTPAGPWKVSPLIPAKGFSGRLDAFVEESLAAALAPALETLAADLARETTDFAAFSVSGTSAESLKSFLRNEYQTGMTSALLVGDLPVAWFQLIDDWNGNGRRDPSDGDVYEEFPCDLYYMDLDGDWQDNYVQLDTLDSLVPGQDSIYDLHSGHLMPEIAVGRLPASAIGNEINVLTSYFDRAHRYRTGALSVTDRALVYIDDDWIPNAPEWDENVGLLYPARVFIDDPETTRIRDYRPRIDTAAYEWISLMSHSWPGGHAMKYNSGQNWEYFYATQIAGLDPEACFYNLFACSNARFVERGYCGGCYVFQTSTGLGAVGSTKTGSMLEFQNFYYSLGAGNGIGQALTDWFFWRLYDGCLPWERSWYYGMCLIGDPSLKPRMYPTGAEEPRQPQAAGLKLQATPNPTRGRTTIRLSPGAYRQSPLTLRIYDASGCLVHSELGLRASSFPLDLRSLSSGTYFLRLDAGVQHATARLVVQH
jgi:hypothetical protein